MSPGHIILLLSVLVATSSPSSGRTKLDVEDFTFTSAEYDTLMVDSRGPLGVHILGELLDGTGILRNIVLLMETMFSCLDSGGIDGLKELFKGLEVKRDKSNRSKMHIGDYFMFYLAEDHLYCEYNKDKYKKDITEVVADIIVKSDSKPFWSPGHESPSVFTGTVRKFHSILGWGMGTVPASTCPECKDRTGGEEHDFYIKSEEVKLIQEFIASDYFLLCIYKYLRGKTKQSEIYTFYQKVFADIKTRKLEKRPSGYILDKCFITEKRRKKMEMPEEFKELIETRKMFDECPYLHLLPAYYTNPKVRALNKLKTVVNVISCQTEECIVALLSYLLYHCFFLRKEHLWDGNDPIKQILSVALTDGHVSEFDSKIRRDIVRTFETETGKSSEFYGLYISGIDYQMSPGFVNMADALGSICFRILECFKLDIRSLKNVTKFRSRNYCLLHKMSTNLDEKKEDEYKNEFLGFLDDLVNAVGNAIVGNVSKPPGKLSKKLVSVTSKDLKIRKGTSDLVGTIIFSCKVEGMEGPRFEITFDGERIMRFRVTDCLYPEKNIKSEPFDVPILDALLKAYAQRIARTTRILSGHRESDEKEFIDRPITPLIRGDCCLGYISYPLLYIFKYRDISRIEKCGPLHRTVVQTMYRKVNTSTYDKGLSRILNNIARFRERTRQKPL